MTQDAGVGQIVPNGTPQVVAGLPGNPGGIGGSGSVTTNSAGQILVNSTGGLSSVISTGSPFGNFTSWLPYFVLMGGALLLVSQSQQYAGLGAAFAALIAGGYFLTHYNGIVSGFDNAFGTSLASTSSAPA